MIIGFDAVLKVDAGLFYAPLIRNYSLSSSFVSSVIWLFNLALFCSDSF
jgi:hypothetical protein